ncbi:hypothetical protein [Bacteroides cellulosilyticus]|jgi:hypothetical protein|uniref:hypothetical protein n=1 Tax=Bacteroides cellulosilyticus TaxID=246787 RepID=UPI0018ABCB56|nr:hypothetical protein [Bacteroides cellulosilyticus]DAO41380.1 MAG TPA: hypothetical protein [Caudoviricetes sp.]DAV21916.1 MAG TPA: hypothetical protein [Caudoviricetes sp.]
MKKRVSKILWYGSDVNPDGSPIIPDVSPNIERNLEGLNEGEIYIHNEDSNPFIFIRTNKNRVVAIGGANLDELFKIFLRKDKSDSTNYLLRLLGGATIEKGLVVRIPKQTPATSQSGIVEEDENLIIEEDEDAVMEIAESSEELSFGELSNVNSSVDTAPVGSLPVKGENEWSYVAPSLFSGSIDEDNMLIPVFDKRIQQMVFVPISVIKGGVTPPSSGFPYTFSFALV